MPVLHIYHNNFSKIINLNDSLVNKISKELDIPTNRVWVFWHNQTENFICPIWEENVENPPVIFVYCKSLYTARQLESLIIGIKDVFGEYIDSKAEDLFIGIQKFNSGELFVNQTFYK